MWGKAMPRSRPRCGSPAGTGAARGGGAAAVKGALAAQTTPAGGQQRLEFADPRQPLQLWEYAVLVTNAPYDLAAIGQLYRDRADCENGFDELKNQWGWGGYTTRDLSAATCRRGRWP